MSEWASVHQKVGSVLFTIFYNLNEAGRDLLERFSGVVAGYCVRKREAVCRERRVQVVFHSFFYVFFVCYSVRSSEFFLLFPPFFFR